MAGVHQYDRVLAARTNRKTEGALDVTVSDGGAAARGEMARLVAELRSARLSNGYTQERLADALGVGEATVRSWEAARRLPSLINILLYAKELGLRLAIVGRDGCVRSARITLVPGESWEHREIRSLAATLRSERRDNGVSQEVLARRVGVSSWSVAQFERGLLHSRPVVLVAWAAALNCGVRWSALV